ncbi:MAG: hypothetical protein NT129_05990 [Candidatus Aenigmarchaeota archaeon]|nr:hypothetical protein [Candidatus Aenigmarchaeota archaeon]
MKKELGMRLGLHAEVGELMSLESSERRLWEQSHLRLVETVKNAADFGAEYVNIHMSARPQLLFLEAQYRVTGYFHPVVSYDGKPLSTICDKNEKVKELAKRHLRGSVGDLALRDNEAGYNRYLEWQSSIEKREIEKELEKLDKDPEYVMAKKLVEAGRLEAQTIQRSKEVQAEQEARGRARSIVNRDSPNIIYDIWKESVNARFLTDAAEITAYMMVAEYMKQTGDPIWSGICGGDNVEKAYSEKHAAFNAACAAKYLEGHLTVKDDPANKKHLNGMSIVEWLEKNNIVLGIETPEAHEGYEALMRLFNPLDVIPLIDKLKSDKIKLCIDFEHMLSHKMKPEEIIPKLPCDKIFLVHLTKPIPYGGTAHIPLTIGSKGQEIIYKWLYDMRKRGFKDGYLVFERGGGRSGGGKSAWEVIENSVWVIRQIVKYLEQDIAPDDLPPEFFGVAEQNKETFARQMATMREHAWDPLEGLLMIPEEKHTFLSRSALEKNKLEIWEKRKFR